MIATMYLAGQTYGDDRYGDALIKAGDFILLAQLPEPQPAWAQQYNADKQPARARRFEPASVTGGESQAVMNTLPDLYEYTGQQRFLQAVRPALDYLKRSCRVDGRLARFCEIGTNRPLYYTTDDRLTCQDDDMPRHYAFVVSGKLDRIERRLQKLQQTPPEEQNPPKIKRPEPPSPSSALAREAARLIDRLESRGAWIESGTLRAADGESLSIIDSRTFAQNLLTLAKFVSSNPAFGSSQQADTTRHD